MNYYDPYYYHTEYYDDDERQFNFPWNQMFPSQGGSLEQDPGFQVEDFLVGPVSFLDSQVRLVNFRDSQVHLGKVGNRRGHQQPRHLTSLPNSHKPNFLQ